MQKFQDWKHWYDPVVIPWGSPPTISVTVTIQDPVHYPWGLCETCWMILEWKGLCQECYAFTQWSICEDCLRRGRIMTVQEIVREYEAGHITQKEALYRLIEGVDEEPNLDGVTMELYNSLEKQVQSYPADDDDEGWSKMVSFSIVCSVGPAKEKDVSPTRRGVKRLRSYFKRVWRENGDGVRDDVV